jgi:YHS domain-containing protein
MRSKQGLRVTLFAVLVALAVVAPGAAAAGSPLNTTLFGHKAVKGYDVVAYFTDGKPVTGADEFTVDWMGATWRFASAEHRDAFKAAPDKFAPRYGGYCAYAVAKGDLVDIDPAAFTIVDGKLYLNYSKDVQKKWSQDIPGYVKKADANWPGLSK